MKQLDLLLTLPEHLKENLPKLELYVLRCDTHKYSLTHEISLNKNIYVCEMNLRLIS